jgi:hypothetical protein
MRRILLDESTPEGVRRLLTGYDVQTVPEMGWAGLTNGVLLAAADGARFDIMVTPDKNIRWQQNLVGRKIALVIMGTNHWRRSRPIQLRSSLPAMGQGMGAIPSLSSPDRRCAGARHQNASPLNTVALP